MQFKSIVIALDMFGCPNRCKHCWLGHSPNAHLTAEDLIFTAEQFRPFTECLQVDDWYREPDYSDDYRDLWDLCNTLSDKPLKHYELISVWRVVRDKEYIKWLSSLGLKKAQLTLFGERNKTDFYTGRKNAYDEILEAIEILLQNKISPRIQVFINKDNIDELPFIEKLIYELDLEKRCKSFGGEFSFFLHQGSCDGENEKLYDIRITSEDIHKIPPMLADYTLNYFRKDNMEKILGKTEQVLYEELIHDHSFGNYVSDSPVFFIDNQFNVYPNITSPESIWLLGNLKTDGVNTILKNYTENRSPAQHILARVPLCEIVKSQSNTESQRLFTKGDYITYLVNRYCRN